MIAALILAALTLAEAIVIAVEEVARRTWRDQARHDRRWIHQHVAVDRVPGPDGPVVTGYRVQP